MILDKRNVFSWIILKHIKAISVCPLTEKIYISKDVQFNGQEFPYSWLFPRSPNIAKDLNRYFTLNATLTPHRLSTTTSSTGKSINSSKESSCSESVSITAPTDD